jgi:DNA-binding Lrp family transcriptional regulator
MEEILEILEKNNKLSEEQIAVMLNKSVEEVRAAIKKFEEDGVILGYNTLINWEKTSKDTVSLIELWLLRRWYDSKSEKYTYH